MNEIVENKVSQINNSEEPSIDQLPFSLFERHQKKTTKLLANSGATAPIEGRNREYRYKFKEATFVSHIVVKLDGYRDYDRFSWEILDENNESSQFSASPDGDEISVSIDEFCKEIAFTPPRAWTRDTKLAEVRMYGFARSDVEGFINFAFNVDSLKHEAVDEIRRIQGEAQAKIDEAANKQIELNDIHAHITEATTTLSSTEKQIQGANQKLSELTAKVGATAKQLEATEERVTNLRSDIKLETQKKEQVQKELAESELRLRELKQNINLFPSEISGFVEHASSNIRMYLSYAFGPLFILCCMFILLIVGAVDLTTVITTEQDVNLSAIIVSRMPYVAVASAIIYASYRLARLFITEVMNINRQRLSLTKVSIIAKDISQAAETQLSFTDEQIYANRLKVKMALLGDHIKHLITTEPELLFPENIFVPPVAEKTSRLGRRRNKRSATQGLDDENADTDNSDNATA